MNKSMIIAKNVIKHLHQTNVILISDYNKDFTRLCDYVFKYDMSGLIPTLLDLPSAQLRNTLYQVVEKTIKYNSVNCVKSLYVVYREDDGVIEKFTKSLMLQAYHHCNNYMINVVLALAIFNNVDMCDIIGAYTSNFENTELIGHIISTFTRYNRVITPVCFEWAAIVGIFEFSPDIAAQCLDLQYLQKIELDGSDILPNNDTSATTFIKLVFSKVKITYQYDIINLMEYAINKNFYNCAELLFAHLDDENKANIITNAIIKDNIAVLRFLKGVINIGPEHAYLCDLCVIHVAMKCLRYLIEKVGLRPTQTTYNLCMRDQRSSWYGDYIRAYIEKN
ncbi:hypothetical protein D6_00169 [Faustovirus]|nr:hypothetical protein D6_00169 [Faustovirus]AMP44283.1 hypothetical protein PRJ_Dakar_00330 [Faustovirus]